MLTQTENIPDVFGWRPPPQAAALVGEILDAFCRRSSAARQLGERLYRGTGTRLIDWLDHLAVPAREAATARLPARGFVRLVPRESPGGVESPDRVVWRNPQGLFPEIEVHDGPAWRAAIKVESVADFLNANRIQPKSPVEGGPSGRLRKAKVASEGESELWVVERHGCRGPDVPEAGIVVFADVDLTPGEVVGDFAHGPLLPADRLGTVGLWCRLHGEAFLEAGIHHIECRFDFAAASRQLGEQGVRITSPFTDLPYLKQAFSEGETWPVAPGRIESALADRVISDEQAERFRRLGAIGSHLEVLQRDEGYKGFNKAGISEIIRRTDPPRRESPRESERRTAFPSRLLPRQNPRVHAAAGLERRGSSQGRHGVFHA